VARAEGKAAEAGRFCQNWLLKSLSKTISKSLLEALAATISFVPSG
jgi:hypothetical protein